MPSFFFHIRMQDDQLCMDADGSKLIGIHEADEEAKASAREIMADALAHNMMTDVKEIVVVDREGREIVTVPLRSNAVVAELRALSVRS